MNAYSISILSFVLFGLATAGFLTTGSVIKMLMFLELALNAGNLALVGLSSSLDAQVYAVLVLAVAAAEAGVGLALVLALARDFGTLNPGAIKDLKG